MENWKDIAGYEGMYQVSSEGRVRSCEKTARGKSNSVRTIPERILKPGKDTCGYLFVILHKNGVNKHHLVHRLVASAFIPNNDLFAKTVNHKNEVKTDNRVENLEWMSPGDNTRYSVLGSKSPCAKQVRCVETGEVFGSQTEASEWLGLNKYAVGVALYRGRPAGGYHWKYID